MSFLDSETLNTVYTLAGIVGPAVTATFILTRWRYERERHQNPLTDMARELRDYITCIEQMRQNYLIRLRDSTSDEDRIFFRRLIKELDDNLVRNQQQLQGVIDRITRGR